MEWEIGDDGMTRKRRRKRRNTFAVGVTGRAYVATTLNMDFAGMTQGANGLAVVRTRER
jgi:hypothetical protein